MNISGDILRIKSEIAERVLSTPYDLRKTLDKQGISTMNCQMIPEYTGRYYECNFNENKKRYGKEVHYHPIIEGAYITEENHISNGIALNLIGRGWVTGCQEEHIVTRKEADKRIQNGYSD